MAKEIFESGQQTIIISTDIAIDPLMKIFKDAKVYEL